MPFGPYKDFARGEGRRNARGQFIKTVELIHQKCPICSREVINYPSDVKRGARFCSPACAGKSLSQTRKGPAHHHYIRENFMCEACGSVFDDLPSKNRKFCSRSCASKAAIRNRGGIRGKNNPNWKGGITPLLKSIRTSKEYRAWRRAVFNRDNYICQKCGAFDRYLHAHHIIPVSEDLSKVFDIDNGLTLCIVCHQEDHPELTLTLKGVS